MQNKTPNEIAAISEEWREVEEEHHQTKGQMQQLIARCKSLFREIIRSYYFHATCAARLPKTLDSTQLSTDQLRVLDFMSVKDQKAGRATWTLYETQKKMVDACNAFERFNTFRIDRFVLDEADMQGTQEGMVSLAATRRSIRELGPRLVNARKQLMWEEENDSQYMD
jgi:hypothetical protein